MTWVMTPYNHGLTQTFYEIYPTFDEFKSDYNSKGFPDVFNNDTTLELVYNLLYANYGLDEITNMTLENFKYKLFATIWQYGGEWKKKLDIQDKLKGLDLDSEVLQGSKAIYNHALNPETDPSTQSLEELTYINEQNTTNYKKSKMDAYLELYQLLNSNVTDWFMRKFSKLFKSFVSPFTGGYVEVDD